MPTIAELTGRFGFDVDESGFRRFESLLSGAKKTLGAAFGVGAVGGISFELLKFFSEAGSQLDFSIAKAKQFKLDIKDITDNKGKLIGFEVLGKEKTTFQELTDLATQLKIVLTPTDLLNAWTLFQQRIVNFAPSLAGNFKEFVNDVLVLQRATGDIKFPEAFTDIMKAITEGDFSKIYELPISNQLQTRIREIVQQAILQGGGKVSPVLYPVLMQQIFDLFRQEQTGLLAGARPLEGTTVTEVEKLKGASDKLLQDIGLALQPIIRGILKDLTDLMNELDKLVNTWKNSDFPTAFKKMTDDWKKSSEESRFKLTGSISGAIAGASSGGIAGTVFGGPIGATLFGILGALTGYFLGEDIGKVMETIKSNVDKAPPYKEINPLDFIGLGTGGFPGITPRFDIKDLTKPFEDLYDRIVPQKNSTNNTENNTNTNTSTNNSNTTMNVTINVNGAQEPNKVATIVKDEIQKMFANAYYMTYPTEQAQI